MCLISTTIEPLIAQEDIICYKVVDRDLKSPMLGFQYSENSEYHSEIESLELFGHPENLRINKALHTFAYSSEARKCAKHHVWDITSILCNKWDGSGYGDLVIKCIIPKGTKYYKSDLNLYQDEPEELEYASEALKTLQIL